LYHEWSFAGKLADLAQESETPWASYAAAESSASDTELVQPLAEQAYTNRLALAAATTRISWP
jgi:hypothetical protein